MQISEEILSLLAEGGELSAKEMAEVLGRQPQAMYRHLFNLLSEGLIVKCEKNIEGQPVFFYSSPPKDISKVCHWQQEKERLIANNTYKRVILETDYWPDLREDFRGLKELEEIRHIAIVGAVGKGKSITGLYFAHLLSPSFSVRDVLLTKSDLQVRIKQEPKKKTFLIDDIGIILSARTWQDTEKEIVWRYLITCRRDQVNSIGTVPSFDMVDVQYRRLVHYVFHVVLKCGKHQHVHIVVSKQVEGDMGVSLQPVGVLKVNYPQNLQALIDDYEKKKQERQRLGVREPIETVKRKKIKVKQEKSEKDKAKQEKGKKKADDLYEKFRIKRIAYIQAGRGERFAYWVAYRQIYEKAKALNLKNLDKAMISLEEIVDHTLVEEFVLRDIGADALVLYLREAKKIFKKDFPGFPKELNNRFFSLALSHPKILEKLDTERSRKSQGFYNDQKGKLDLEKWQKAVEWKLVFLEKEAEKEEEEARSEAKVMDLIKRLRGIT